MVEVIWFTEWLIAMSWLPKREKLDPKQASAIDFAVAQDGNFYVSGEAGTGAKGSDTSVYVFTVYA